MTDSNINFDAKTGELARGGQVMTLSGRRAQLFAALNAASDGQYTKTKVLADLVDIVDFRVATIVQQLRPRLMPFGITIEAKQGCGYRLVIGEIPKWAPKIPETTTECTLRESDLVPHR